MSVIVDDVVACPAETGLGGVEASLSGAGLSIVGANFGESVKKGTQVKTATGIVLVDSDPEPRTITLKLVVRGDADVTLPEAAHRLEQIVGYLQGRNSWIRRDFHASGEFNSRLYHVTGEVTLADFAGWQVGDSPDVTLVMVCDSAAYSTEEVESEEFKEEADRELIYTLPASGGTATGLKDVRVTNLNDTEHWRGLIWGEECEGYQPEVATALPAYAAADLTVKGGAVVKTVSGLEVVEHDSLTAGWLTILDSKIAGVGHMTHRGARRIWLRAEDAGAAAGDVQLRIRWRALGSLRWSEDNAVVPSPLVDAFQWLDMGECRPQLAALGEERWECQVQARAPGGSGTIRLHRFCPVPTEQYAVLRAPRETQGADAQSKNVPASAVSLNEGEFSAAAWEDTSNATKSDGSYATAQASALPGYVVSEYLSLTNCKFGLPETATVLGVASELKAKASGKAWGVQATPYVGQIVKGGTPQGISMVRESIDWIGLATTDEVRSYGSASFLGGLTLSVADVNAPDFGVAFAFFLLGEPITVLVDSATVTVYYTEADDENRVCFAQRSAALRPNGAYRQHPEDDVWGEMVFDGFPPIAVPGGLDGKPSRGIVIPSQGDLGALADVGSNALSAVVKTRDGCHFAG